MLDRPWWMENANCKGQGHLFFAPQGERPAAREKREKAARNLCADCSVLKTCRTWARENREIGFWGGESEIERAEAGFLPAVPIIGYRPYRTKKESA